MRGETSSQQYHEAVAELGLVRWAGCVGFPVLLSHRQAQLPCPPTANSPTAARPLPTLHSLVPDLASTCPDADKRAELLAVHREAFTPDGKAKVGWGYGPVPLVRLQVAQLPLVGLV